MLAGVSFYGGAIELLIFGIEARSRSAKFWCVHKNISLVFKNKLERQNELYGQMSL